MPPERKFAAGLHHVRNHDVWDWLELSEGRLCGDCNIPNIQYLKQAKQAQKYMYLYLYFPTRSTSLSLSSRLIGLCACICVYVCYGQT